MQEVAKQVYVETAYDGVTVGAMVTPTGVICFDVPSYARDARDWAARMHRLSPYPVQNIILTDSNGDRVMNTRWLNAPIIMQQEAAMVLASYEKRFPQTLIESLSTRNPHRGRELSNGPVEHATTSFSGEIVVFRHGQQLVLKSAPGPLLGNCWVMLPERGVIYVGDTLVLDQPPLLAASSLNGWLNTLDLMRKYVKTHVIVPGRGEVLQPGDPLAYERIDRISEYLIRMRDRITRHIDMGNPIEGIVNYVPEFFNHFELNGLPPDWVRHQIRLGLGYCYHEVQSNRALDE
ncbi:MAG: hypothetical protein ACPG8W_18965 [Candidatus Promineifilaceae bacterium]